MAKRDSAIRQPATSADDDTTSYIRGPGHRKRRTPGPNIEIYADGPIDRPCHKCGAEPLSFCRHDDGTERKIPCLGR